ncbi:hypothetical protein C2S51_014652 [Perilla frutescens var. frutescens]|nr:hypothetical protein C2S51_014652 [Perilla frutescens var. frutescens]
MPPSSLRKFLFISALSSIFTATYFTHSYGQCLDNQRSLLLELKNELIFNSSISEKLVQWNQTDECCSWYGVECDAAGYVISLQLDDEGISGGIGDSSSLFRLKHLEKLNLAYNNFNNTPIPRGIHNLTYLTHLNLSYAPFGGQVPLEISFLKRLVSLDISKGYWLVPDLVFEHPNLEMILQNLTGLRELYLDAAYLSDHERREWSHIISSYLPYLRSLSLNFCVVSGPIHNSFWQLSSLSVLQLDQADLSTVVPDFFANFSSLTTLSLDNCDLKGHFPEIVFQLPTLKNLDLSANDLLTVTIPPFTQTGSLESLVLTHTNLTGLIPSSISNLKALSHIDLFMCRFKGEIPSTFANLTQLVWVDLSGNLFTGSLSSTLFRGLSNLVYLDLRGNFFSGTIPQSLFGLPSLSELHLGYNQFTGQVEEFPVVTVSKIRVIDLSNNRLEGPIPDSFFQLQSLESLLLSSNLFNGTFQLEKIQNFPNLTDLDLSGNNLSVDVGSDNSSSYVFPKLKMVGLASCNLYDFPGFIKHSDLSQLNLANNHIAGEIPSWIWGKQLRDLNLSHNLFTNMQRPYYIPASLQILDLQSNQLREELHLPIPPAIGDQTSNLQYLSLANNSLSGLIPTSLCNAKLDFLDLSVNKFGGHIPLCLRQTISSLQVLNLGRNNISGRIPDILSVDCYLQYFDLNNNTLQGEIPKSLERCMSLEFMNIGNNNINDTFPCMLSSSLRVLVLHSNRFHGEVRCNKSWPDLQIMDISSNNFTGNLVSINFSSWSAMMSESDAPSRDSPSGSQILQLSRSYYSAFRVKLTVKGIELELVKIRLDFTAIDFSCNNLKGELPNAVGDLSSLHLLNLSHNHLNGSIPKFYADSFRGNPGLCGFSLNISCSSDNLPPPEHEKEQSKTEIEWEYVSAALGYVVGLGSIVWLLLFCRSFRDKYFGKVEEVVEEIFAGRNRRRRQARRVVRNQGRRK